MALAMLAVIMAVLWLVVTDQLLTAEVTLVGALPAAAVLITSDGAPATEI
jgi:multisubunit Na+/H+ antiporter MnhE subunit